MRLITSLINLKNEHFVVVVFEVNLIIFLKYLEQWWVDTSITWNVCTEKMIVSIYKEMDGEHVYMKNSSTSKVLRVEKVILKKTFKKLLTLNNVFHVVDIKIKLMFGSLLSKNSYKLVFKCDKFVLSEEKKKECLYEKGNTSITFTINNHRTYLVSYVASNMEYIFPLLLYIIVITHFWVIS
jgi:hypothetical protein